MDAHLIGVLSNVGVISFVALSAYLLLLTGEISFGQQAFFAIGAYAAGVATAVWGWTLAAALAFGATTAAGSAALVGLPTLRVHGVHFAVATLAFAEMMRIAFEMFRYRVPVDGDWVGPDGADGFRGIRYLLERDVAPLEFMGLIYALLAIALGVLMLVERSRFGVGLRMIGHDETLAALQGIPVARYRIAAAAAAGALAAIGGGLYAHLTTYVEPRMFDVMLGVHALAYGLIGGLGTALGPVLGVLIDVGLLESIRGLAGYRMIVFGGLVALLLIVRPRGLLDEAFVHRAGAGWRRLRGHRRPARTGHGSGSVRVLLLSLALAAGCCGLPQTAQAQVRARAGVDCSASADRLVYDCVVALTDARTGRPLTGVTVTVAADMPSMPGVHRLRPAVASEGAAAPGVYRARLALDMHGEWALQIDLSGPLRDRVVTVLRFEPDRVEPARRRKDSKGHAH